MTSPTDPKTLPLSQEELRFYRDERDEDGCRMWPELASDCRALLEQFLATIDSLTTLPSDQDLKRLWELADAAIKEPHHQHRKWQLFHAACTPQVIQALILSKWQIQTKLAEKTALAEALEAEAAQTRERAEQAEAALAESQRLLGNAIKAVAELEAERDEAQATVGVMRERAYALCDAVDAVGCAHFDGDNDDRLVCAMSDATLAVRTALSSPGADITAYLEERERLRANQRTPGTADMVKRARAAGLTVIEVSKRRKALTGPLPSGN